MRWLLLFLLVGCGTFPHIDFETKDSTLEIEVELAITSMEQTKGLMFRDGLAPDKGMLFVFDHEETRAFWMKNVKFPIDIIFMNANWEVVDIQQAEPCVEEPCEHYVSKHPTAYVLEVNEGFANKHGILEGHFGKFHP
ncbi:MAG: DUF192 domain-containing protein [Candidatus Woesearchaeota archaeon]|jgi:hypothetical protein|nr:DUF192 domain-containing protein [Candidatus Woesearchaeota archaeon]MDP7181480.1 DUF192 domain-containing protein [Candidatus Woesearchaeota archaeon]MDP7198522.1 DUF192 domain-containing protein [Candidatus Woesearchaeota archaeon]MDP7466736.1 DUF192 domain-containing protein [Candidatus Woesearchaeota archaeon]MDP7647961.1 DUF192 domain-containing protein [Candidatus Woesearchaeota archaeon]|tara:strand:- start:60 stop:473 length:414 start_codon:yes stop_codon:yes gene_type:complete